MCPAFSLRMITEPSCACQRVISHPRLCNRTFEAYRSRSQVQLHQGSKAFALASSIPEDVHKQKNGALTTLPGASTLFPTTTTGISPATFLAAGQIGWSRNAQLFSKQTQPSLKSVTHFARFWWLSRFVTLECRSGNVGPGPRATVTRRLRHNAKFHIMSVTRDPVESRYGCVMFSREKKT